MIAAGQLPSETPTMLATEPNAGLPTITPTFTPISFLSSGGDDPGSCVPVNSPVELGLVMDVIDSVTLIVSIDGQEVRVRYIGLQPTINPYLQPWATEKNFGLTINQVIMLLRDVSDKDASGNLLRYVFIPNRDGVFVNYEMVRQGYARAVPSPPDMICSEVFRVAEEHARYNMDGLWAPTPIASTTAYRILPTFTPPPDNVNCDPSYPTVCIPGPPPYLHCGNIRYRHFTVLPPDPHEFDSDGDGIGCEN
jgi:micrococcal nuclease